MNQLFWLWDVIIAPRRLWLWKENSNYSESKKQSNGIYLVLDSDELASFDSVILEYFGINFIVSTENNAIDLVITASHKSQKKYT